MAHLIRAGATYRSELGSVSSHLGEEKIALVMFNLASHLSKESSEQSTFGRSVAKCRFVESRPKRVESKVGESLAAAQCRLSACSEQQADSGKWAQHGLLQIGNMLRTREEARKAHTASSTNGLG